MSTVIPRQYDCIVYISKYIGNSDSNETLYDTEKYYEIFNGLQSVTTTVSIDGRGSANIIIIPPVDISQQGISAVNHNILIERKYDSRFGDDIADGKQPIVYTVQKDDTLQSIAQKYGTTTDKISKRNNNISSVTIGQKISILPIKISSLKERIAVASDNAIENNASLTYTDIDLNSNAIKYYPILDATKTQCFFKPMDKVKVFMQNRFDNPNGDLKYSKVFEGLIDKSTVNYNNGGITITIQCSDIAKWLLNSIYNFNPALSKALFDDITGDGKVTPFQSNLASQLSTEIIKNIVLGSEEGILELTPERYQYLYSFDGYRNRLFYISGTSAIDNYNTDGIVPSSDRKTGVPKQAEQSVETKYFVETPKTSGCGFLKLSPSENGKETKDQNKTVKEIQQQTDFNNETLYIDPNVKDFPPVLRMFKNVFELWNHQYKNRWDIIKNDIIAPLECEFFMDSNGQLVYKPPYYNINPGVRYRVKERNNITADEYEVINGDQYLIFEEELKKYTFTEDDSGICTVFWVEGKVDYDIFGSVGMVANTTYVSDVKLAQRFGYRAQQKTIPLFGRPEKKESREDYAKSYMNRKNSKYKSGSISITLRPELSLGKTIAIIPGDVKKYLSIEDFNPYKFKDNTLCTLLNSLFLSFDQYTTASGATTDDGKKVKPKQGVKEDISNVLVYYINSITHTWKVGTNTITTISLTHGRYWEQYFGLLNFSNPDAYIIDQTDDIIQALQLKIKSYNSEFSKFYAKAQELNAQYNNQLFKTNLNNFSGTTRSNFESKLDGYKKDYEDQRKRAKENAIKRKIATYVLTEYENNDNNLPPKSITLEWAKGSESGIKRIDEGGTKIEELVDDVYEGIDSSIS